jgi:protein phosphatase
VKLPIPELCLVVLIGPSGSGKSTFAAKHFLPTEVISSDYCRGLVCDDVNSMDATVDAFDVLRFIAAKRLARGRLTVIDATNVQEESRANLIHLAREHDLLPVAVVLNLKEDICHQRNRARGDRNFGPHVIRRQCSQLRQSLRGLEREGFRYVHILKTPEEVEAVEFERTPLWNNRKSEHGPFDIIGDVHGCYDELVELLTRLGYTIKPPMASASDAPPIPSAALYEVIPPPGRKAIFLGDLVDRGPDSPAVLRLVMSMVAAGTALCVPGNHDAKLLRKLRGRDVKIAHGLAETLEQLAKEPPQFAELAANFIDKLVGHYVLDDGKLVVAHAGMKQQYIGRSSARVRDFALYGETTGESDDAGLPIRHNWAAEYRGPAMVVYGHTPVYEPEWLNHTINIDTGCVFGGKLSALRYPEREVISVSAKQTYAVPARPLAPPTLPVLSSQQQHDDMLDIADVLGKRIIQTELMRNVTVREENASAALEVMSRFAIDPRWLIYLPSTISPTETSSEPGLLEHPREAFDYYRAAGVLQVICEEKHMGSRAVGIVCRDESVVVKRFGIADSPGSIGIIYTRTGRRFFDDLAVESQLLETIQQAITRADLWKELETDWFCLDCELMPWSAKAQDLLRKQYAAVGAAATAALAEVNAVLAAAGARYPGGEINALLEQHQARAVRTNGFVTAYSGYCWPVNSVADLKLAPFHLLASEGHVYVDRDHRWHMETLARLAGPIITATKFQSVNVNEPTDIDAGIKWWEEMTAVGGEGMVVKPLSFIARNDRGLVQPAMKCRGKEYLRIIYGPEYDAPENLVRLRKRGLSAKRSMAAREFALGVESLQRFVKREPLRRVHECVFGVLALESEPVDSRL